MIAIYHDNAALKSKHVYMCYVSTLLTNVVYLKENHSDVGYRSIEAFKCYCGSLLTPSFRRSTASSGRTIKYLRYGFLKTLEVTLY